MKNGQIIYLENEFHYIVKIKQIDKDGIWGDYKAIIRGEPDKTYMHDGLFLWKDTKEIKILT